MADKAGGSVVSVFARAAVFVAAWFVVGDYTRQIGDKLKSVEEAADDYIQPRPPPSPPAPPAPPMPPSPPPRPPPSPPPPSPPPAPPPSPPPPSPPPGASATGRRLGLLTRDRSTILKIHADALTKAKAAGVAKKSDAPLR